MRQLVSLIKWRDVERVGDQPAAGCASPCGPTCGCPAGAARPPAAARTPASACAMASGAPAATGADDDESDAGMSTVEYAVGTVAAAAFAAVLYQIVTGGSVLAGLTDLINRAMSLF